MATQIIKQAIRKTAVVDVHLVSGLVIRKGQEVSVSLHFDKEWSGGGFRTVVNNGLGHTNHDAWYECFK